MNPPKREKRDVNGWAVLDKPIGMTSTTAVAAVRRIFKAKKAGHAGTLDPLASGVLPIALGEATKTVPFVQDGRKIYRFTVRFGIETDTDDAEGKETARSSSRPSREDVDALLPAFTGTILQTPPQFSALKVGGERAYDLARGGETVELAPREIEIESFSLIETPDADHAEFEVECGKGTYVRSLARDIGRKLGCLGHVSRLRRMRVGDFAEEGTVNLMQLEQAAADEAALHALLQPVAAGLQSLPAVKVSEPDAQRLAQGQSVFLRGRDAPVFEGPVSVSVSGNLVALAEMEAGALHPRRIFNLPR
ncbi:MAG: tRNA pseudouridine(55) synthase TruB [Xanthobacteraceae bacterium]|nr:tRNA pseudouridine(55) synthase TruB [Xanthobacteraceae bacterium]